MLLSLPGDHETQAFDAHVRARHGSCAGECLTEPGEHRQIDAPPIATRRVVTGALGRLTLPSHLGLHLARLAQPRPYRSRQSVRQNSSGPAWSGSEASRFAA